MWTLKRVVGLFLSLSLTLATAVPAMADQPISVQIDGRAQTYDQPPVIVDSRTMVPLRAIFEALGATVTWDGATRTVNAIRGSRTVALTIGAPAATVDGITVPLAVPARIISDRTMVPLRFVSEALGAEVLWHGNTRTVDITTNVGGTVTFAMSLEPEQLLPVLQTSSSADQLIDLIYDPLIRFDDRNQPHPSLARSWQVGQDRIYTFALRTDVSWHDGQPFTARDVAFTFQAIAHPGYTGLLFNNLLAVKGVRELSGRYDAIRKDIEAGRITAADGMKDMLAAWEAWKQTGGIQAVDDFTFRVELEEPFAPALQFLGSLRIMPEHLLRDWTGSKMAAAPQARAPVGTGAYRLSDWAPRDHITLERNPDWSWGVMGQHTHVQHIVFKYLANTEAIVQAVSTGAVDAATITPDYVEKLRREGAVSLVQYQPPAYFDLGYNLRDSALQDVNVRRAFTHALDRAAMVQQILQGQGVVLNSNTFPGRMDFTANLPVYGFDLAEAGRLLDSAGWKLQPDGLRWKDGRPLSLELLTSNSTVRLQVAGFVQQALAEIGVTVAVRPLLFNEFIRRVYAGQTQMYVMGWGLAPDPDDAYDLFHTGGVYNTGYHNARVDELLELGRRTVDQAERVKIYQEVNRLLAEDQPMTWLFTTTTTRAYSKRVQGIMSDRPGDAGPEWHFDRWYVTNGTN